ncbi:hypothetical protein FHX15_000795 [Rhizobium sp. BK650]|uniref:hypothetical protein n=1 Tax=Rhizobium sp. BK650 TaxID=2586990 RepID=UPI001621175A|nr:hypothetical protein [Rhizobium sp. BK650]MBB3655596.1 hypothetical protein [Rhizobium sp. BK650]
MEAKMFDEIVVGLAALKARNAAISDRPQAPKDQKYARIEVKVRSAKARKRAQQMESDETECVISTQC